mgnify:FL=1
MPISKKKNKAIPKYIVALTHLLTRSMNQLEALNLYGDTCFNSTISVLAHDHGFNFKRVFEPHTNRAGTEVRFMRYWLIDQHTEQALRLVRHYLPDFTV